VRVVRLAAAALAALLSSACLVVSLHPVYEPETIAFDPLLLGTWTGADDDVRVTFERAEWHSYHLTIARKDDRLLLTARLTRVGAQMLLDVSPRDGADVPALTLPVHGLYRLELTEDGSLRLADLNYDALERRVRAGTAGLPAAIDARANVVIMASTAELRAWLAAHAADEELFDEPASFTRR
jgi:hypothetical protein